MAIETTSDLSLVGTSQIVDGSVTSAKIGTGAVGSAALADNAVVAAKISAGSVGTVAISSGSATSGQILQANGSGAVTFETPAAGGGMTLIATATPSAATTISFTSIPTTYKHLVLVWRLYQSVNTAVFAIRLNNDSGNNYHGNFVFQRSTETRLFDGTSNDRIGSSFYVDGNPVNKTDTGSGDPQLHSQGQLDIYSHTDTTGCAYTASSRSYSSQAGSSGYRNIDIRGVYFNGGTAINRIDFVRNSTQTVSGTVYLYGVS
jgi:hypothetical protein